MSDTSDGTTDLPGVSPTTTDLLEKIKELESTQQALMKVVYDLELAKTLAEAREAKDQAILSNVGDGLIVTDAAGNILMINKVATAMMRVEDGEVDGKVIYEKFPLYDQNGEFVPRERRPIFLVLHTGQRVKESFEFRRSDGTKFFIDITATSVMQSGKLTGAIAIIRDVTKEKDVDRMKTEFISLASHQLRTPLSAINWFSEMLLAGDAGPLSDPQKEFAQNIIDSTRRMIDLVNALLNISRIESGRIIVDPKLTDLSKLLDGIVHDLKGKIEERQQNLAVSVYHDLPLINIGQVYLNLLTNAIKYTSKGGDISVLVSRKGDELISQVSDNGYGIPKSEQGRMFQKFFRATNIAKVETDGTGLGMYLIKAIIESSGGKIWFESEEGKGTTFWFSLPMSGMKARAGEVSLEA
jgi:PAS domain S-box-containing protein